MVDDFNDMLSSDEKKGGTDFDHNRASKFRFFLLIIVIL